VLLEGFIEGGLVVEAGFERQTQERITGSPRIREKPLRLLHPVSVHEVVEVLLESLVDDLRETVRVQAHEGGEIVEAEVRLGVGLRLVHDREEAGGEFFDLRGTERRLLVLAFDPAEPSRGSGGRAPTKIRPERV
jgi:hypothetical protein